MRNFVLLIALLLSACAGHHKKEGEIADAASRVQGHRNVELRPAVRQRPVIIEKPQPAHSAQGDPAPKRHEHNIEED